MTRKSFIILFVLALGLILFSMGCSKDLSEGKAEKQIKEYFKNNPGNLSGFVEEFYGSPKVGAGNLASPEKHDPFYSQYRNMEKNGFITVNYVEGPLKSTPLREAYSPMFQDWRTIYRRVNLTNKGKEYLIQEDVTRPSSDAGNLKRFEVLTALNKFDKITGITEPADAFGVRVCMVTYQTRFEFTPFAEFLIHPQDIEKIKNNTNQKTATFVLLKDGWKLDSIY